MKRMGGVCLGGRRGRGCAGGGGLTRKLCPKSVPFYQLVMDFVDSSCRVVDLCEKT